MKDKDVITKVEKAYEVKTPEILDRLCFPQDETLVTFPKRNIMSVRKIIACCAGAILIIGTVAIVAIAAVAAMHFNVNAGTGATIPTSSEDNTVLENQTTPPPTPDSPDTVHEVNMDNVIYLQNNSESECILSIYEGRLTIGCQLEYYLEDNNLPDTQTYAVSIKFSSSDFRLFMDEKYKEIEDKYHPQFDKLHNELYVGVEQVKYEGMDYALFQQIETEISEKWNELFKDRRNEEDDNRLLAYEYYFKPVIPLIEELGIEVFEKKIDFVQDGDIRYSEMYCVAYVDRYLIEQLDAFIADKNFGLGIELAPEFLERDSSTVDLRDPCFRDIAE